MKKPCNKCNRIHGSDCAIAINRFSKKELDKKYKANFIGSIERETKQEAEKDYCNYYEKTRNNKA